MEAKQSQNENDASKYMKKLYMSLKSELKNTLGFSPPPDYEKNLILQTVKDLNTLRIQHNAAL